MQEKGLVGRPREFDEADVLSRVMDVFWQNGYEGTSLADLMEASGLKKGSLYAAFGDKHAMYLKALQFYELTVVDAAVAALTQGAGGALRRVRDFLQLPIDAAWSNNDGRGCFLCNASADHAGHDKETSALVARSFDKLETAVKACLSDGGLTPTDARLCARMVLAVYAGLRIMARSARPRATMEAARDGALELVKLKGL